MPGSSQCAIISGTYGNTGSSAFWIRYSRPMSCADFALVPEGGRRRIRSRFGYSSRYVQFDAPLGYCVTFGMPSRPGNCAFSHASSAATSSSSPSRTAPARSTAAAASLIGEVLSLLPHHPLRLVEEDPRVEREWHQALEHPRHPGLPVGDHVELAALLRAVGLVGDRA